MMAGIVLLGPPGAGKGTQAIRLKDALGLLHLSTGDVLRKAVSAGSPLGRRVQGVMASGALVSDDLVGEVVEAALRDGLAEGRGKGGGANGFLLDGFPRTVGQVEILDGILERTRLRVDDAVMIDADEATLVRRLTGRRVCGTCGTPHHLETSPPPSTGRCDACGGALLQRNDDREEVVAERLRVYRKQTAPVVAIYRDRGLLREIDGSGSPDAVFVTIMASLRGVAV